MLTKNQRQQFPKDMNNDHYANQYIVYDYNRGLSYVRFTYICML